MVNVNQIEHIILIFLCVAQTALAAQKPINFYAAKKYAEKLFSENRETLYCHCVYDEIRNIQLSSCNMLSTNSKKRAHRVEWEHMMPVENFGRYFKCWKENLCTKNGKSYHGRACCERVDSTFKLIEAELYNIWPSVGLVNQVRSNYPFSHVPLDNDFYGCPIKIDRKNHSVEPPDWAKGTVARANLFMSLHYNIPLTSPQRQLFLAWNKIFPPSIFEKKWGIKVAKIEGYSNPFIN